MGNSLLIAGEHSTWIHDSRVSQLAFYLKAHLTRSPQLPPDILSHKEALIEAMNHDLQGIFTGSLDLGCELVKKEGLEAGWRHILIEVQAALENRSGMIPAEELRQIDQLCVHHDPKQKFYSLPTQELINELERVIQLFPV
ncbi:MAG: hypothetical protein AAF399_11975 [Bacteroidota bacterium]